MTDKQNENPEVLRAYALLGLTAAQYSALEFHSQFLLSMLHSGKEISPETIILTRNSNFSQKVKIIREMAAFRFIEYPEMKQKILDLASDIEFQRETRNHFFHGYWLINWAVLLEGVVRVSDTKWSYKKEDASYSSMETTDIKIEDLEKLPAKIGELITRVHQIIDEIKLFLKNQMERDKTGSKKT